MQSLEQWTSMVRDLLNPQSTHEEVFDVVTMTVEPASTKASDTLFRDHQVVLERIANEAKRHALNTSQTFFSLVRLRTEKLVVACVVACPGANVEIYFVHPYLNSTIN